MNGDLAMKLGGSIEARRMQRQASSMRIATYLVVWLPLLCLGKAGTAAAAEPAEAAEGAEPAAATKEPAQACAAAAVETAKEHFSRGVVLTDHADHQGALQAFQAAYAACPHFAIWYNIGQALIDLDRPLEAVAALSRYLREGQDQIPPERIAWVIRQIRLLEDLVGELYVETMPSGALITVDGRAIGRTPLADAIRLEPGEHKIWATLDDYEPATSTVVIGRGKQHDVVLHLIPLIIDIPPPVPRPSRVREALPYILIGTGAALGGTAVGVYLWNRDRYQEWQALVAEHDKAPPNSYESTKTAAESNRKATSLSRANLTIGALAITSGVLVVLGGGLYYLDHRRPKPATNVTVTWAGGGAVAATWRYAW
jgi:hypothetical protein